MPRPRAYVDAFSAECPTREVLDRISSKWVSLVLVALADAPSGYRELLRRIEGVSPKMLTQTLRALETDGIVLARRSTDRPSRSVYALTDLGRTLLPVLAAVKLWAEDHLPEVLRARELLAEARPS
ncbi:winged helix-turn-helix transcriptional regulator [Luteimicrobium sp. DT211]|uniref:winged helix-turn-helix transcriptional regulator n=1 Tax=Luteimicrobium sp. DT211 TaxID=3393412 RepID=UPI003CEE4AD2